MSDIESLILDWQKIPLSVSSHNPNREHILFEFMYRRPSQTTYMMLNIGFFRERVFAKDTAQWAGDVRINPKLKPLGV